MVVTVKEQKMNLQVADILHVNKVIYYGVLTTKPLKKGNFNLFTCSLLSNVQILTNKRVQNY